MESYQHRLYNLVQDLTYRIRPECVKRPVRKIEKGGGAVFRFVCYVGLSFKKFGTFPND